MTSLVTGYSLLVTGLLDLLSQLVSAALLVLLVVNMRSERRR